MKAVVLIFSFVLTSLFAFSADYFWVGGHGNWSDLGHWATTSGGAVFQSQLPGSSDDVYFDSNSFTGLGQTVTLDLNPIEVGNFNCTGVQFFPTMASVNFGDSFEVHGDFIMPAAMQRNMGVVSLRANTGQYDIVTGGVNMGGSAFLEIFGSAEYFLQDDVNVNFLYISDGTLHSNDFEVDVNLGIVVWQNGDGFLDLGSSQVYARKVELYDTDDIDASQATITLENPGFAPSQGEFKGGGNHFYRLICQHSNQIYMNNSFDILEAMPGSILTFEAGTTQTAGEIDLVGTSGDNISLLTTISGVQATLSKSSGTVDAEYLVLKDMNATGGAVFTALTTIDQGNNTGWNIDENLPEDYYWIGGTGFTTDLSHWAKTSGGPEIHTESPGLLDDVIFDENSFSSSTDIVTINSDLTFNNLLMSNVLEGAEINCDDGLVQTFVHGSLQFAQGIVLDLETVHLAGDGANSTIETNGAYTGDGSTIKIDGGGLWTLLDDFSGNSLELSFGGLITDGNGLSLMGNLVVNGSEQTVLDISNSEVTCRGWRPFSIAALYYLSGSEISIISDFNSAELEYNIVRLLAGNTITFSEDCSISELIFEPGADVEFESGTTVTVETLDINGSSDDVIEIYSSETGNPYFFSKSSGNVDAYYMNIFDNHAIGGADFVAHESTLNSGVMGWSLPISVEEMDPTQLNVYPNPTNGFIQIETELQGNIMIYDSFGRVVKSEFKNTTGTYTIDINNLAQGMYYITIENSGLKTLALLKN